MHSLFLLFFILPNSVSLGYRHKFIDRHTVSSFLNVAEKFLTLIRIISRIKLRDTMKEYGAFRAKQSRDYTAYRKLILIQDSNIDPVCLYFLQQIEKMTCCRFRNLQNRQNTRQIGRLQ